MKVEEVENNAVGEVAEASIVDNESLTRVNHLQQ